MSFGMGPGRVGPGAASTSAANGLPFGGIPEELQRGVDELLGEEPDHGRPAVSYDHARDDAAGRRLSLRALVFEHWHLGALALVFVVAVSVFNQAGPWLIQYGIDHGMSPRHPDAGVVVIAGLAFIASVVITAACQRSQARVTGRLAARVMYDLRIRVFTHLQRLGLDFYTAEKAGVIMTRMTSDIENLQQLLQDGLAQLAVQGLTMVVITVVLFSLDVELAWITLAMVLPLLILASLWFRAASATGYVRVRDGIAGVLGDLSESLHGVRTVAAYNRFAWNIVAHRNVVGEYRDANNWTARVAALYGPGTTMLGYLAQAALLAIGGHMVLHHELSLGALVAFFLYTNRFFAPIQLLVQQYNTFQQGQASIVKLRSLFSTEPAPLEAPDAVELGPIAGALSFDGVSFAYGPEGAPVLTDVDLSIAPGETVAFVGPTGAGKSTLAKLITRFYDPTAGTVRIDGHDLRTVTIDSLRRQLGVVPQEPFLFAGTLRDNIAFARPEVDDAAVWAAVDAVGLGEVVDRLPDGLDTIVHERGQSLSSGERQLIALARAFHAQPRVLVLDEATSNLDLLSESRIEAALDVLLEARTAVLIAHRLTTAMKADRIVVVDGGRVVEVGSHDDLVAAGGRYAEMFATWTRQAELTL